MAVSGLKLKTLPAVTVATAGSEQPLASARTMVYAATVVSLSTNTGTQYLGDSTVTSSNGIPFSGGDTMEIESPSGARGVDQFDLSKVYVDSSSNGAEFRIVAWIRE